MPRDRAPDSLSTPSLRQTAGEGVCVFAGLVTEPAGPTAPRGAGMKR